METRFSIRNQTCPNNRCIGYEKEFLGNIVIHGRSPQRLQCTYCKKTWVAHKKSKYFGLRSNKTTIDLAKKLLDEGMSIRATAKELCVSPSTIQRWKMRLKKKKIHSQVSNPSPLFYQCLQKA